ncbi:MAG: glutathione S-transferase family protein, partial [Pseudomonadota bacterium]
MSAPVTVYGFAPAWGLPSTGPFTIKLLGWLALAGVPHRFEVENNPGRGPLGKSPWAVIDGETVGD